MLIQSDSIQATLLQKAQSHAQDRSRHLLCPSCRVRTKLYTLKDGRKKCSACGSKFNPDKKTDAVRLKQCADILLCFSINFTAQQASMLSGYRYRLVSALYDDFRLLLAKQNLEPEKIGRLSDTEAYDHSVCGQKYGDSPVFGVKILPNSQTFIAPLFSHGEESTIPRSYSEYAGFICRGKFHRFKGHEPMKDGAEQLWAWMSERLRPYHGIWKRNIGLYLKELEWKYNNRQLTSEVLAMKIAELMPEDFLASWSDKKKTSTENAKSDDGKTE